MPRPRAFDEQLALRQALELFWRHGYEATSLDDLTGAMAIGRQSLYAVFGDKRALFLRALAQYHAESLARVRAVLEAPGSPRQALARLFAALVDSCEGACPRGCFSANTMVELAAHDAEVRRRLRAHNRRVEALLGATLERARAAREVPPGLDVPGAARALHLALVGLATMGRTSPGRAWLRDAARAALGRLDPAPSITSSLP